MTVARRFPKLILKSDATQLTLSANALAVLSGVAPMPSKPAPKQLPIIVARSFRIIIMLNTAHYSISLFRDHLRQHLVANTESLGIATVKAVGDASLTVEMKDAPCPIHPPYATLDYIALEYRLKPTHTDNASFSESQELFLPLRTLLDEAVHKLLFIQLPRNLPLAFSQLKEVIPREVDMARRMGGYVDRVLLLSPDSRFQATFKKQFKKIRKQAHTSQSAILEQLDLTENHFDADSLPSLTTTSELLQYAVTKICQNTFKPKIPTKDSSAKSPSLGIVELLEDADEPGYLASQESYGSLGVDEDVMDLDECDDLDSNPPYFLDETLEENTLPLPEWMASGTASFDLDLHLLDDDHKPSGGATSSDYASSMLVNSVTLEDHVWSTVDEGFDFSDTPQGKEVSDEEDSMLWLD